MTSDKRLLKFLVDNIIVPGRGCPCEICTPAQDSEQTVCETVSLTPDVTKFVYAGTVTWVVTKVAKPA